MQWYSTLAQKNLHTINYLPVSIPSFKVQKLAKQRIEQ